MNWIDFTIGVVVGVFIIAPIVAFLVYKLLEYDEAGERRKN